MNKLEMRSKIEEEVKEELRSLSDEQIDEIMKSLDGNKIKFIVLAHLEGLSKEEALLKLEVNKRLLLWDNTIKGIEENV